MTPSTIIRFAKIFLHFQIVFLHDVDRPLAIILGVFFFACPLYLIGAVHLDNATHMLPNFALFYENGSVASTGVARAELITVSALNWAAAITGMSPSQSGIVDRKWLPPNTGEADQAKRKCSLCNSTEVHHRIVAIIDVSSHTLEPIPMKKTS